MKLVTYICITLFIISAFSFAQEPNVVWTKTFGTAGNDSILSIRKTPDGGFIVAGHINYGQAARVYLIKTDCLGNIEWETSPAVDGCEGRCVDLAVDGGYVVVGQRYYPTSTNAFLMKFLFNGDLHWYREYPHSDGEANYIQQTTDEYFTDCYLIVGSFDNGPDEQDAWTIIVTSNGTIIYADTLGSSSSYVDRGFAGCEVGEPAPGFVSTGKWSEPGDFNIFLRKFNPFLVPEWTIGFGGDHEDEGRAIKAVGYGDVVVTGLYSDDVYGGRAWLVKRDYEGNLLWEKFIADAAYHFSEGYDLEVTNDGGFIISGTRRLEDDRSSADVYVVKTDENGDILWYEEIGGEGLDESYSIEKIGDNAYVVAAVTRPLGTGSLDGFLIKLGDMLNDTDDPLALANNGNRHLVRESNTEKLHLVYTRGGQITYQYSSNGGADWDTPENLGAGEFPAITLDSDNFPSVAWTDEEGGLWYRRKISTTNWSDAYHLDDPIGPSAPHLNSPPAIAVHPSTPNTVHILVTRSGLIQESKYGHTLEDFSFPINDPTAGWFNIIEEKLGPLEPPLRTFPSIARCEVNNSLHATWQRVDTICYAVKPREDWWDNWGDVFDPEGHQSAHSSVETYGDSIIVVWQRLEPSTQKEDVYRGARHVSYPEFISRNVSQTPNLTSAYPVNASGFFTAYAEEPTTISPYDIYYKTRPSDDRIDITSTLANSAYPQCAARFTQDEYLYTAWQEGNEAPYAIKFEKRKHLDQREKAYLSSANGQDLPSPYLVARDSFVDDWQIPVDIGNMATTYRFPLAPGYAYKAKAVVYHEGSGPWSGRIKIDNNLQFNVTYNGNVPETLECWIPPVLYADSVLTVSFHRIAGDFAAIGPIYIYRYEYESSGGGPMSQQDQPMHSTSIAVFPNPFTERLNITYQTTGQSNAELKVYDVTGRLVKQFALPSRGALNQIVWDGVDDQGRAVPQGVYFLRVDNPDSGDMLCQKVLRVR